MRRNSYIFWKKWKKKWKNDVPQNVSCLNSTFLLIKLVKNHTTAMITLDELIFFFKWKKSKKVEIFSISSDLRHNQIDIYQKPYTGQQNPLGVT